MNADWIKECDHLKINGKDYYFRCTWSFDKKAPNNDNPSIQLIFHIWNETDKCWIDWNKFKGSYLAEKFTNYVKNTLNGQRTCYWDTSKAKDFGDKK